MSNKVTFGLEKVHIAFSTGMATWGIPIPIPGAVGFKPAAAGQEKSFYADNGQYFVSSSNNGYTAELEMALIPDEVLVEMLGWEVDGNGMIVEKTDATPKKFALMGQVCGDQKNRRFVYYDCQASRPEKEHSTKNEGIEPATDVLKLTIMPIEISGKNVVKGMLELGDTNAPVYNAFFDAVTIPNKTPAAVVKTSLAASMAVVGTLTQSKYTPASWTTLQSALTTATTVSGNASATQAMVNSAKVALDAAILKLVAV